jgi:cysteine sulfinate desulfinase/cysteine desulfurase-like protein/rhodanese-related sulfurtransferase
MGLLHPVFTLAAMNQTLYLDSNATSSVLPAAVAAASACMAQCFGNPSSSHSHGLVAKHLLDQTRDMAGAVIGAGEGELVFTSGATEAIQTAVLSALCAIRARRAAGQPTGELLLYGATEHKAVPEALAHWNQVLGTGLVLQVLPVDQYGRHDAAALASLLPKTAMLCTMAANNETGTVSDLEGIARLLATAAHRPLWLVDGVQALGKMDLQLPARGVDYAVFSGHKLHAPKGIGLLYVRRGAPFTPLVVGGGQEAGLRSGTENMPGIAALGAVLQALQEGDTFTSHATLKALRDQLEHALRSAFPAIVFNTPLEHSLPTTLNFSVPGLPSKRVLDVFDAAGLRVSAGSACSAGKAEPSHVLVAMGLPAWRCESAVRLSIGLLSTEAQVTAACDAIARCGQALAALEAEIEPGWTVPILSSPADATALAAGTLHWHELDAFLNAHPAAQLVDLREVAEQQAGGGLRHGHRTAVSAPVSELPRHDALWFGAGTAPVVLVCRSGNRSQQVAQWLHSQGHTTVRHLHGGLALRP